MPTVSEEILPGAERGANTSQRKNICASEMKGYSVEEPWNSARGVATFEARSGVRERVELNSVKGTQPEGSATTDRAAWLKTTKRCRILKMKTGK